MKIKRKGGEEKMEGNGKEDKGRDGKEAIRRKEGKE